MVDASLLGSGAAIGGLGLLAGAYGNAQGADAMASARSKQREQQMRLQAQADHALGKRVGGIDIAGGLEGANADLTNDAVKRMNIINSAQPAFGGNYGAGVGQGMQDAQLEATMHAGRMGSGDVSGSRFNRGLQDAGNEQQNYADKANNAASIYDEQMMLAANKGQTARLIGQVGQAAGPGIANYGIWSDGAPGGVPPTTAARRINPRFTASLFGDDLQNPYQAPLIAPHYY